MRVPRATAVVLAVAVLSLGVAAPCRADLVFTAGNHPQPNQENVLLNNGTTGMTVFGLTNQTSTQVRFDSTQTLTEPSNGQARIQATSGDLNNISISVPSGPFASVIFNMHKGSSNTSVTLSGVAVEPGGGTKPFSSGPFSLGSGENFFTVTSTNGEKISSVTITTNTGTGFTDLRQIRLGTGLAVIPEPGSLALLCCGAVGLVGYGWRRQRVPR
jgi:hypothetical protein